LGFIVKVFPRERLNKKGQTVSIIVKIASSSQELKDVYKLRHSVYCEEEGYFQGITSDHILDIFDTVSETLNIIAYHNGEAVGTMRVTKETEIGTPSEEAFDFSGYREKVTAQAREQNKEDPVFISAGMLAIAAKWRNRRDVFRAIFRMAVDIGYSQNVSHIIATVNDKTATIYKRLGWEILSDKIWIDEFNEYIVAVATPVETMYEWAFGNLMEQSRLLEHFSGCFQWLLLDRGTVVFEQGNAGDDAYVISKGSVDVSCHYPGDGDRLSLAVLGEGDMFGELSLIDEAPRSATITALSNCELLVINREVFWQKTQENPTYLRDLMGVLSARLRKADERALLYAYANSDERLDYFVKKLKDRATIVSGESSQLLVKVTVGELSDRAAVSVEEAQAYLNRLENQSKIVVEKNKILFNEDVNNERE